MPTILRIGPYDSSSMRATVVSRHTFTLNARTTQPSSGSILCGLRRAGASAGARSATSRGSWKKTEHSYREGGMSTLAVELQSVKTQNVVVTDDALVVDLSDGRTVSVPLAWYPRLLHATQNERSNWRLIGGGEGIHWPDLDEDISVENLLMGRPSGESQTSFQHWLKRRATPCQY